MNHKKIVKNIHRHIKHHHKKYFLGTGIGFLAFKLVALFLSLTGIGNYIYVQASEECNTITDIPNIECEALVDLYNNTDGANWTDTSNWMGLSDTSTGTACDRYGITCDAGNIVAIDLAYNNLSGTLANSLGNFSELVDLTLSDNNIQGYLPMTLANLSQLEILNLASNQLTGSIPLQIYDLNNLQQLILNDNQLDGVIPNEIGQLTSLTTLSLKNNFFGGDIRSLANIETLNFLDIENNQFEGTIPNYIQLGNFTYFAYGLNNLVGILNTGTYVSQTMSGSVTLVDTQYISTMYNDRDGIILEPTIVLRGSDLAVAGEEGLQNDKTYTTIEVGTNTTSLFAGTGYFQMSLKINEGNPGEEIKIYVSDITDGDSWTGNKMQSTCILDSNKNCNFISHILALFAIELPSYDTTPNRFSFDEVLRAEIHTPHISNSITIDGLSPGIFTGVAIDTGILFKNGDNIGQSGTGGNGDVFEINLLSSDNYNTKVSSTLNIGGVIGRFDISTRSDGGISDVYEIYIDPTYTGINGTENGTITRPFNSWTDITGFQSNVSYLQKKGTTYTSSTQIFINGKNNITIGSYGSGARPLFSYLGGGYAIRIEVSNNILVQGLEINGNTGAYALIGLNNNSTINPLNLYFTNNRIDDCVLHNAHNTNNAGFGIHASYNDGLKITNTTIYNVAVDGIYTRYEPNIEIGYCNIYDVNRRYFENTNQTYSNGDGIQLDGNYNGFHIHHTTVDRTNGAANKFNVILASAGASINATGIIEYNTFITDSAVTTALHIEHGSGIITRYNTFMGITQGIRIGGAGTKNNLIHNNVFYNNSNGIGVGYTYSGVYHPIGPSVGTKIYNNIFYHVSEYHIWVDKTHVESRNNIHIRTTDSGVAIYNYGAGSWTISNNFYGDVATAGTPGIGTNSVIGNPLFVNAPGYDFHLQAASPAIDTGINVGFPYSGAAPDIGAFEYVAGGSDLVSPTISTGYIFSGTTGNNGSTLYYKGTVDIKADVSDNSALNTGSCEYTTGGLRNPASYSGTDTLGYCYKTSIVGGSDLNINFRVRDNSNNLGTGSARNYIYDATAPTFTFANKSGFECRIGTMSISSINEIGIGLDAAPYNFNLAGWITNPEINIPSQQAGIIVITTGYVRDALGNISVKTGSYTFNNSPITSNSFTINTEVSNKTTTGNWKMLSNASDLRCGSGDISYSGIITQGTKGTCSVLGDIISYTPSINKTGSDTCTIQIKDNENSIANVTATWTGINTINENIYYVSFSSGNDTNNGTSPSTAWKTIAKVNSGTFFPGDSILFKRGDVRTNEKLIIHSAGNLSGSIYYGDYGSGEKPKISGLTTLSGRSNEGSGIYSKSIIGESIPNMVTVDGINTALGRRPNTGYLTIDSHVSNTSLSSSHLNSSLINRSGATVVIRKHYYIIDRNLITSHSGNTINYVSSSVYDAINGFGFFIQNDIKTLDQVGERAYTSGKIFMYFGGNNPNMYTVKVSTKDKLLSSDSKNYISINNLAFEGANTTALEIITSNNFVVSGCDIKFGGKDGINIKAGSNNTSVINSLFEDNNNNGLYCATREGVASGATIRGNTFNRSALIPGMGGDGDISGIAAYIACDNALIENNTIYQAGFNGIHFDRSNTIVRKNYISQTNSIKYDGAGIYTWQGTYGGYTGMKIQDNIIINTIGANEGTNNMNHRLAHGIYIDDYSEGIEINGNTCAGNMGAGIKIGSSVRNIDMSAGNTLYNNIYQYHITRLISGYANIDIGNSILFSLTTGEYNYRIEATVPFSGNMNLLDDRIQNIGTVDNNHRSNISGANNVVIAYQPSYLYKNFSQWKSYSNLDSNSTEHSITTPGNILFEYNTGDANKIVTLSGTYTDVYGNIKSGNLTILPYSSTVLIKYFETSKPIVNSFSIPSTASGLTVPINAFTASDNIGVVGYLITESSSIPSLDNTGWIASPWTNYTFSSQGTKTLYARAKDAAGNISTGVSDTVIITLPAITTYYLSPSGSDTTGDGSFANPWFSFNKAWTIITGGNTLYLRGGTYQFGARQDLFNKNGSSGNIIKVFAYSGEKPVLSRNSTYYNNATIGIYFKGSYFHFKGITISGFDQIPSLSGNLVVAFWAEDSNYNTFELFDIHHNGMGMKISGNSSGNIVLNSDFHHNSDPYTNTSAGNYGNADGLDISFISGGAVNGTNTVRGCRFWWNSDDGMDVFSNDGYIISENNRSRYNGYIPDTLATGGDGNGFKLGPTSSLASEVRRKITNSIAFSNRKNGFEGNGARCKFEYYNNTSCKNGYRGFKMADEVSEETLTHIVMNNISYMNTDMNGEFTPSSILQSNTWIKSGSNVDYLNPAFNVSTEDFVSVDGTGMDGPRQNDGSLPVLNFLRLATGSDMIDGGIGVGLPFNGSAPDLGAFEYITVGADSICGNGIIESDEECDYLSSTGWACDTSCKLIVPSCDGFNISSKSGYAPLNVTFTSPGQTGIAWSLNVKKGTSYIRTENNGTGGETLDSLVSLVNSGDYDIIFTGVNLFSGALNCIMTGIINVYDSDYIPDQFTFNSLLNKEINTFYTSNIITISGMSPGLFTGVYLGYTTSGFIYKNGINIGHTGTGGNGDQFYLSIRSSNTYRTYVNSMLHIGPISGSFLLSTKEGNYIPNQFSFINKTGTELNTLYTSNVVIITGMSPGLFTGMSVNNGYIIKNNINIGQSGTGGNGDQIILALTSSNTYSTTVSSVLNVGGMTGNFVITTKDIPGAPTILGAINGSYYSGNISLQISGVSYSGTLVNGVWNIQDSFVLSGIDNSINQYYLTAYNTAGNYSTIRFTIDKQAPQNLGFNINNGAIYTTGVNITLTNITGTDVWTPIDIAYGTPTNPNNWTGLTSAKYFIIDNAQGSRTVYMRFRDAGGNISITSGNIILDTIYPVITIYNPSTNPEQSKTISGSTNEGILYQSITSGNVCDGTLTFSSYQSIHFTSESDNGKKVCYKAVDSGGNISYSLSNPIQGIDKTGPTITIYQPNTSSAQSKTISGSTNESGYLHMSITTGSICDGTLIFSNHQTIHFTNESDNGKKVCYRAADSAGNISYSLSNPIQGIDKTGPTITVISPSTNVGTTGVLLSITSNENAECRYSSTSGTSFSSMIALGGNEISHTGNYIANEGSNILYFKCVDIADNYSDEISYQFTVDSLNPVAQFVINTLPASTTNSNSVNISITGTNSSAYKYKLVTGNSCLGVVYDGTTGNLTTPITQGPSISDQQYSYCIVGYNSTAGWSITGNKYTFIYDSTAPVMTIADGVNPSRNTGDTINLTVDYNLAGTSGTKYVEINNVTSCNSGTNFESSTSYTPGTNIFVNDEGHNGKYLCFKSSDLAGNISYTGIGILKIDKTAPTTNISDTGSGRRNTNVNFGLSCNDGSGIGCQTTYYKILSGDLSCDAGNYTSYSGAISININAGETLITSVCYYAVDSLGNGETYKKQLYKIDKKGPSIDLLSPLSGGIADSGTSINFVWSGSDNGIGISGYIFRLSTGINLITGIYTTGTSIVLSNLLNGNYLRHIEGIDMLGNTGISNTQQFVNINSYVVLPSTSGIPEFISEFTGKGYLMGTGSSLFESGSIPGVLVGITPIYFGYNNEIKSPLIMSSTGSGDRIEIKIESGIFITETGINAASCENFILTPEFISNTIADNLSQTQKIFSTFVLGNNCLNSSLVFTNSSGSNKKISVKIRIRNLEEGSYHVWYSQNGTGRSLLETSDYEENTLEFLTDHMTYFTITQDKESIFDNLLSMLGGGKKLTKDNCKYSTTKKNLPGANEEGEDYSDSYYDKDCGTDPKLDLHNMIIDGIIDGSPYGEALNKAYLYAYRAGITTIGDINRADMMGGLLRKHMAKMISNYATNILGKVPDESRECNFVDMNYEDIEMQEYAIKACQLGLMGLKSDGTPNNKFYPGGVVTRDQFGTALSRLLYGETHNAVVGQNRYSSHLKALKNNGIMNNISQPGIVEKRGYVMLMLMRAGIN